MALIEGSEGTVTIDAVPIGYLTNITISIQEDIQTIGPFISDPNKAKVRAGTEATGSAEGIMTSPIDAGQDDVIEAIEGGNDVALVIEIGDPAVKTFTAATVILSSLEIGLDTGEGAPFSFEFEVSGAFTLT